MKERKRLKKKRKKEAKKEEEDQRKKQQREQQQQQRFSRPPPGPPQPEPSRAMVPMTKEEWERQQSVIRKVYDADTGRHRLIRGSGEVIEEIVSQVRQREINR